MAKERKTVDLSDLKARVNRMIEKTESKEAREALAILLSSVLMDCNAYKGFNYVEWLNGGSEKWAKDTNADLETKERIAKYPMGLGVGHSTDSYIGDKSKVRFY